MRSAARGHKIREFCVLPRTGGKGQDGMEILSLRPLADQALTLDLAEGAGPDAGAAVTAALSAIENAMAQGDLPGVTEVAGAFRAVTVHYDCLTVAQADLAAALVRILAPVAPRAAAGGRLWHLPCCYDAAVGIDLPDLSAALSLPVDEIIALHAGTEFPVLTLGFLPGLPFLGGLPAPLARPRRSEPRTRVPAGSVAIANRMCVIYPWVSPGGWHIVGTCPVPLFDVRRPDPALLSVGDRVRFVPVDRAACDALRADYLSGARDPADCLAEG